MSGRITKAYFERVVERSEPLRAGHHGHYRRHRRTKRVSRLDSGHFRPAASPGRCVLCAGQSRPARATKSDCTRRWPTPGLIHLGGTLAASDCSQHARHPGRQRAAVVPAGGRLERLPAARRGGPAAADCARPTRPTSFDWAQRERRRPDAGRPPPRRPGSLAACLGAILAPSMHGVRYAAGTFRSGQHGDARQPRHVAR